MATERLRNGTMLEIKKEIYVVRRYDPVCDRYELDPEKTINFEELENKLHTKEIRIIKDA